jgi:phage terminase small subunit
MKRTEPKIDHLQSATRKWFQQICRDFALESHHLRILLVAAEMWDRSVSARDSIAEHGLMIEDRYGCLKANPACELERSSKTLFLKAVRELGLDVTEPGESRPPIILGNASRRNS